ncbi:MAG: hypothetical protein M1820_005155 [Bogoriella megaspora]|nr:MAG: hypothetical protein M1820_005155 [Bogoriella megaspora]
MWTPSSIPDLTGKVMLVTGGNAGLGREAVKQLALHGAKVYMGARSEKRATQSIKEILSECPSIPEGRIVWLQLDLSDLSRVVSAAQEIMVGESRLDVLVNNAGTGAMDFITTKEGFELTMATNHVGHFVLTSKLLPLLKATAGKPGSDVRVVNISSVADKWAPSSNILASIEDLNDPCASPHNAGGRIAMFRRYGLSKLANILFTRELQHRLNQEGVDIIPVSANPGPVSTQGGLGAFLAIVRPVMRLFAPTPEKGAIVSLFCATADDIVRNKDGYKGQFLGPKGDIATGSLRSQDMRLAETLWKTTETALKNAGIE